MDNVLAIIRKEVENAMNKMDIILSNIEYVKEGKYNFLRIELDKVNGIDLDTIVEATNVINPILDELDLIEDNYILDVISKERG